MLIKVDFKEGQLVRKGQLLALIDPRPFQAALDQAKGQLLHDQALLADAKLDLARYRTLAAQNSIAGQTLDTQAALVKQDQGTVVSDQANVANAALNLSFTRIPAPVAGRVGLRQVDPGNQITANSTTPIVVVTEISPMDVVFSLPEEAIPQVASQPETGAAGPSGHRLWPRRAAYSGGFRETLSTLDNCHRRHHRYGEGQGPLRQWRGGLVSQPVRKRDDAGQHPEEPDHRADAGHPARSAGRLRLAAAIRQDGKGPHSRRRARHPRDRVDHLRLKVGETVITDGGDRLREGAKVVLPGQKPTGGKGGKGGSGHHRRSAAGAGGGGGGGAAPGGG